MKVALYARVSTDDQEPGNQVRELRRWAEGQDSAVVGEYVDYASGARRRERLDDLFDDARRRKFDIVVIWSLDRLTREGPLATLLYLPRLSTLGVKVYRSGQKPGCEGQSPWASAWAAQRGAGTGEKGWSGGVLRDPNTG